MTQRRSIWSLRDDIAYVKNLQSRLLCSYLASLPFVAMFDLAVVTMACFERGRVTLGQVFAHPLFWALYAAYSLVYLSVAAPSWYKYERELLPLRARLLERELEEIDDKIRALEDEPKIRVADAAVPGAQDPHVLECETLEMTL